MTINYDLPAGIQKRIQAETPRTSFDAGYVFEATLVECVQECMSRPMDERCLFDIHTEQQPSLTTTILEPADIVDIAARPDFPQSF